MPFAPVRVSAREHPAVTGVRFSLLRLSIYLYVWVDMFSCVLRWFCAFFFFFSAFVARASLVRARHSLLVPSGGPDVSASEDLQ